MVVGLAGGSGGFRSMILDLGPEGRRTGGWRWRDPSSWDEELEGGAARRTARSSWVLLPIPATSGDPADWV
jgi:hypothetical protein